MGRVPSPPERAQVGRLLHHPQVVEAQIGRLSHSVFSLYSHSVFRLTQCRRVSVTMPGSQLSPGSLKNISDHFPHLLELTINCDSLAALAGDFHLYYNSLVQRGVNIAVKINSCIFYYNFAHPDVDLVKRTLLTKPLKVDLLLQEEHQLPLMLEAVVTHERGFASGGLTPGLGTVGFWFATNQIVTSNQDVQRLLTSLKQVRYFCILRGIEEEVKEAEMETIDQILTMLADKERRGKLDYVQLPKGLLIKSAKWVEHLGGEAEIEKAAAPNYFPWAADSSVGVLWDFGNRRSGRLLLAEL